MAKHKQIGELTRAHLGKKVRWSTWKEGQWFIPVVMDYREKTAVGVSETLSVEHYSTEVETQYTISMPGNEIYWEYTKILKPQRKKK